MQPEVNEQKPKEKRKPTPVEQWDLLAAKVIEKELAPKGFKGLKSGSFRGLEIANHSTPGITKATVRKTQNIGASLVRGYREKLKQYLKNRLETVEKLSDQSLKNRDACRFWQVGQRKMHNRHFEGYRMTIVSIRTLIEDLDIIEIK